MKISCCLPIFFFCLAGVWSQGYRGESSMDEGTLSEVRAQGEYQFQAWVGPWMMRWVLLHERSRRMFFPKSFIRLTELLLCPCQAEKSLHTSDGSFLASSNLHKLLLCCKHSFSLLSRSTVIPQSLTCSILCSFTQMRVFWWCCWARCDSTKFWRELVSWIFFEVELFLKNLVLVCLGFYAIVE
jgi:hypothetical protein